MMSSSLRRGSFVLAILPVLILAAFLFFDAETVILSLFSDDAFYYLKIARSIAEGRGSSFDGIAPTNGYHPLWMLVMVGVQNLVGGSLFAPLMAVMLLESAVCGLTLALLYQSVERWEAPGFGVLAVALCLNPLLLGGMINGLETAVLLFAMTLFVWCSGRYRLLSPTAGARARFTLGLLLGFIFLCRLDSAFLVLGAGVLILISGLVARMPFTVLILRCLALVSGVLVLALPFFVWNYTHFGHLSPISGLVKSSFPAIRSDFRMKGDMQLGFLLVTLNVLLALAVARLDLRRGFGLATVVSSPLSILTVGAFGHFINAFLFMAWGVYWWHFVVSGLALALGVAELCQRLENSVTTPLKPALRYLLPALMGLSGIGLEIWIGADKWARHREWYEASNWAREHTPNEAIFAMKDAGLFGYFSERRVVNLDGKANGYDYFEHLNRSDVRDYLERVGVSYVADINFKPSSEGHYRIALPRVGQPSLQLWMPDADRLYLSNPYPFRLFSSKSTASKHLAIWSFHSRG